MTIQEMMILLEEKLIPEVEKSGALDGVKVALSGTADKLKETMSGNTLFDYRNRWYADSANKAGFDYYGVGRHYPLEKKEKKGN